jgi:hypothetical protein
MGKAPTDSAVNALDACKIFECNAQKLDAAWNKAERW